MVMNKCKSNFTTGLLLFFSVYQAFEMAVANVSRRREEYKFQQLKKQFAERWNVNSRR